MKRLRAPHVRSRLLGIGLLLCLVSNVRAGEVHGLKGQYYLGTDLETLKLERIDAQLDFNWSREGPVKDVPREFISVRWTGAVEPQFSELYTFHTLSDDGVRLWVNDRLLIDNWTDHGPTEDTGSIQLEAGKRYNLRLEYYQGGGEAVLKLLWSSPSQRKQVIPHAYLLADQVSRPELPPLRVPALEVAAALPDLPRGADWESSQAAFESVGIPRSWLILAPQPDRQFRLFQRKKPLDPETTDDWRNLVQDPSFRPTLWTRPEGEEAGDMQVDVGRILNWDTPGVTFARTEVVWPLEGRARIWFSCRERGELFLDNARLLTLEEPPRTPRAVLAVLKRGTNVFKVKLGGAGGPWGFSFRVERDDPAYRIALLKKLSSWHPAWVTGARGVEVRLSLARALEEAGQPKEALKVFQEARASASRDEEVRVEVEEAERRLQGRSDPVPPIEQAWPATVGRVEALLARGEAAAADAELRLTVARYPRSEESVEALVWRGRLRLAWGLGEACQAFFRRAADRSPRHAEVVRHVLPYLDMAARQRLPTGTAETLPELSPLLEAARRQLRSSAADDVARAVRNLDEAWRMGAERFVAAPARGAMQRHLGVPLAIRQTLERLEAPALAVYAREVETALRAETDPSGWPPDIPALVRRAARYPLTPAALVALNRAANRLLDLGRTEDAAALLGRLIREAERLKRDEFWSVAEVKRLQASLAAGGQALGEARLRDLEHRMGQKVLTLRGKEQTGAEVLRQLIGTPPNTSGGPDRSLWPTLNGHVSRARIPAAAFPSAWRVAWRATLPRSPSHLRAGERLGSGPAIPPLSYPVVAMNRVFVATRETLSAFELETGRLSWQVRHTAGELRWPQAFEGYPVCSPTYADGALHLRVLEADRTSLCAFSADDGRLRWRVGDELDGTTLVWLGDPAVACDSVYGVYMERVPNGPARHGVACLAAGTGQVRWRCTVQSGTAGWLVEGTRWMPALHQGPPAVSAGVVYAVTGLNSVVALDAFTGQPLWLTSYPAPETGEVEKDGWFRPCLARLLRRGPTSPLVLGETVFVAPRDAPGLFAFDAATGNPVWSSDLSDALHLLAGEAQGLSAVGAMWERIDPTSGAISERSDLQGARLGCPAWTGTRAFAATTEGLAIRDAGAEEAPVVLKWKDLGLPPASGCFAVGEHLLLTGDREIALLSAKGARDPSRPLEQAQAQAEQGNWAEAGRRFAVAMRRQREAFLDALCGWATAHLRMGFERRAQAELDHWLSDQPARLVSSDGLWEVDRDALREGLKVRLGQTPPVAPKTLPRGLPGVLAYAGSLPLKEPQLLLPPEGMGAFVWAAEEHHVCGIGLAQHPKILWRTYHGLQEPRFEVGPTALLVWDPRQLVLLDRLTGQWRWSTPLDRLQDRVPAQARLERFVAVALDREVVVAATRDALLAFDLETGRPRWAHADKDRNTRHLGLLGGRVVEVGGEKKRYYRAFDLATGQENARRDLGPGGVPLRVRASLDGRRLALRTDDEHLACLDLASGEWSWNARVRKLKRESCRLSWRESVLTYEGESVEEGKTERRTLEFRAQDGEPLRDRPSGLWPVGSDFLRDTGREDQDLELERIQWPAARPDAEPHPVWRYGLSREVSHGGRMRAAFLSEKEERVHLLFTRTGRQPHFVLRSFDWPRGQFVHEEILPGIPFRDEGPGRPEGQAETFEDWLVYTAQDGLYALRGMGQTRKEAGALLEQRLAVEGSTQAFADLRRARAGVEPPSLHVPRAPDRFRLWCGPEAWTQADTLALDGRANFVPLASGEEWRGPADLSATLQVLWNVQGLLVAVTVLDDRHVPAPAQAPLETGDCLRLALDGTADLRGGFDPAARWSGTLACANGRTVFKSDRPGVPGTEGLLEGGAVLLPDGRGVRYEVQIPWALLGRPASQRPGPARQMRLGVAVYDNDGFGIRGALEWGAGTATASVFPPWLGQLYLLDVSREWMERHRAVISKIPDTPEALGFLRRLALSHRGPAAAAARVAELEAFVKAHPGSAQVVPVLRMLYRACKELEPVSPRGRLLALARAAKLPAELVAQLDAWPAPAGPGQGLEGEYFDHQDFTGLALVRVDPVIDFAWGADGPAPSIAPTSFSVRWTGQIVSKFSEPHTFHVVSDDGVRLWVDDRLLVDNWTDHPASEDEGRIFLHAGVPYDLKLEYFQGVGGASVRLLWSSPSQAKALVPTECLFPSGLAFLQVSAPATDPAKMREAYREASRLLPDTPEGAALFERLLDTWPADAWKDRIRECEAYLKAQPGTQHAGLILDKLREWYPKIGLDPVESCKALMRTHRIQEDIQRGFFRRLVPAWTDWQVIGPFHAVGLAVGDRKSAV